MAAKKSPMKAEPLIGFLRHFVRRDIATFSTVRKYKKVSVSFNFFQKIYVSFFSKVYICLQSTKKVQTFTFAKCTTIGKVKESHKSKSF